MFSISQHKNQMTIEMSSSWKKIGLALLALADFLELYEINESSVARSGAVLREMLTNAIRHGNRYDETQKILATATYLKSGKLCLSVTDGGEGFDYHFFGKQLQPVSDSVNQRGAFLIRSLTDKVEFNSQGNAITVYLSVSYKKTIGADVKSLLKNEKLSVLNKRVFS